MNWVEMSSRGQGDRMSLSRFPQSPTHVAEAGGQGCPSGHSGQLRSAGTSSRATEANSSPWDGEILHFPTAWALQSSADRAFLQFQVFSSGSWSAPGQGWRSMGWIRQSFAALLRNSPCSALTGTELECSVLFGDPNARERMKKQRWFPGCCAHLDEVSQENVSIERKLPSLKENLPWEVWASPQGNERWSHPGMTWLLWGTLSDIFRHSTEVSTPQQQKFQAASHDLSDCPAN